MSDRNFGLASIRRSTGPTQHPCESTPSPHLVIAACGVDEEGRPVFGRWAIVVVPHGLTLPVPVPHCDDIGTMRWIAHRLAEIDIDWTAPQAQLVEAVQPVHLDLLRQCDEADAASTPPGVIPVSTMRQMCEANARVAARQAGAVQP